MTQDATEPATIEVKVPLIRTVTQHMEVILDFPYTAQTTTHELEAAALEFYDSDDSGDYEWEDIFTVNDPELNTDQPIMLRPNSNENWHARKGIWPECTNVEKAERILAYLSNGDRATWTGLRKLVGKDDSIAAQIWNAYFNGDLVFTIGIYIRQEE